MIPNYQQLLREAALEHGATPEEKASALNLVEAIISDEMSVEDIVNAVMNDTLPQVYYVKGA